MMAADSVWDKGAVFCHCVCVSSAPVVWSCGVVGGQERRE